VSRHVAKGHVHDGHAQTPRVSEVERILSHCRVPNAKASPREVIGERTARLVVGIDYQEERVVPFQP
jgi:hypothetical protein